MTLKRIGAITAAFVVAAAFAAAQKPKSQKEVDALRAIQAAATPDDRIKAVDNLIQNFADTEFKAWAYGIAADAAQQKGDGAKVIIYSELALEADPKSFNAMIMIATELAQSTRENDLDKEEKLAKAEKYANQAIATIPTAQKLNPNLPDEQWEAIKKDYLGDAHRDLGMVAMVRKKYDVAIAEFKQATEIPATPDPANLVRLATAYNTAGRPDDALATVAKVLATPNLHPVVKQFAETEQKRAQQLKEAKK